MDTSDLVEQIIIPLVICPIVVGIKMLYDRWSYKKKEVSILRKKLNLDKTSSKLKDFYWPIYILLLKEFDLWSCIDIDTESIIQSDSDSSLDEDITVTRCMYKNGGIHCNNPVAKNCSSGAGVYCLRHYKYSKQLLLENVDLYINDEGIRADIRRDILIDIRSDSLASAINQIDTRVDLNVEDNLSSNELDKSDSDSSSESLNSKINNINGGNVTNIIGNFSGNKIGEIRGIKDTISIENNSISDKILKNIVSIQDKIYDIIEQNIFIAEPNSSLGKQLMKYIKFSNIIKVLYENGTDITSENTTIKYPRKLLPYIEIKVFKLQKLYNTQINECIK